MPPPTSSSSPATAVAWARTAIAPSRPASGWTQGHWKPWIEALVVAKFVKVKLLVLIRSGEFLAFPRRIVAAVEETASIRFPSHVTEFDPLHDIL